MNIDRLVVAAVIFAAGWTATKHYVLTPIRGARQARSSRKRLNR